MKSRHRNLDNLMFQPSSQSRHERDLQLNTAGAALNRKVLDGQEFLVQSGHVSLNEMGPSIDEIEDGLMTYEPPQNRLITMRKIWLEKSVCLGSFCRISIRNWFL
jgi:hypothetical protein